MNFIKGETMTKKLMLGSLLFMSMLYSSEKLDLNKNGISVTYIDDNDESFTYDINRNIKEECKKVNGANPDVIWDEDYASSDVPKACKKTFVTTVGKISPMVIEKGVKTVGELEVIEFIKDAQGNKNLLLIDARLPDWYLKQTIPTAENIPFNYFNPEKYPDEFQDVLEHLGVSYENNKYNFKNARKLLLFCNGSWCLQSALAIKNLTKLGYPKEKLLWYRGGMYSWKMLNLTTIEP